MNIIKFKKEEFNDLKDLISSLDKTKIKIIDNKVFNTIWLKGESDNTELYLKSGYEQSLIISRIGFKNRHQGIGTKVLEWLTSYAKQKGFKNIMVESTSTKEINRFCEKYGFDPIPHLTMEMNGEVYGNYIKQI